MWSRLRLPIRNPVAVFGSALDSSLSIRKGSALPSVVWPFSGSPSLAVCLACVTDKDGLGFAGLSFEGGLALSLDQNAVWSPQRRLVSEFHSVSRCAPRLGNAASRAFVQRVFLWPDKAGLSWVGAGLVSEFGGRVGHGGVGFRMSKWCVGSCPEPVVGRAERLWPSHKVFRRGGGGVSYVVSRNEIP